MYQCLLDIGLFSIIRRENTGRVFALEALLEEDTMRFCRERNNAFWRDAEKIGCIPGMAQAIMEPYENRTGPVTSVFDLRRYGAA